MSDRPPTARLSFSEIQAEQERERSASRRNLPSSYSGGSSRSFGRQDSGASYGSRSRGSGGGDGSRHHHHHHSRGRGPGRYSHYPLEQGRISHIKDSFGFIYCANREDELFYHFSDVTGCHPADLNVDDEVQFRVAPSSNKSDKMAAYDLVRLEPGTVQWEVEEEGGSGEEPARFQGVVETMVPKVELIRRSSSGSYHHDGGSSSSVPPEGSIRILMEREDDGQTKRDGGDEVVENENERKTVAEDHVVAAATGPVVHFMSGEPCALPNNNKDASSSKTKPDASASSKPTKMNVSRLCVNDLVEFRVVTSLRNKKKYARGLVLLQSNKERQRLIREEKMLKEATLEQGVVVALKRDFGFLRSNKRREHVYFQYSQVEFPDEDDENVEEGEAKSVGDAGQAATDNDEANKDGKEEMLLKEGQDMEFLVVTEAQPGKGTRVSARRVRFLPKGAVVFHHVLGKGVKGTITRCPRSDQPAEMAVGRVKLDQPIVTNNGETHISEVAFFLADSPGGIHTLDRAGSMRGLWVREGDQLLFDVVRDTVDGSCRVARTKCLEPSSGEPEGEEPTTGTDSAVRLIEASFVGRAEGTIASLKEDYGFVTLSERNTDAYFRYEEVLPDSVQTSLGRKYQGEPPKRLAVGCEVQFDLSLQGGMPSGKTGGRNRKGGNHEKLKAARILLLPPSTILQHKLLAENVRGVVTKEDGRQGGSLTIEEKVEPMAPSERHPFIFQVIEKVKQSGETVVFPNLMGAREDELITRLVKMHGEDQISVSHLPVTAEPNHPGRICLAKVVAKEDTATESVVTESAPMASEEPDSGVGKSSRESKEGELPEVPALKVKNTKQKKAPNEGAKLSQTIRFDKNSLGSTDSAPPGKGDIVTCSVYQSRRNGVLTASNITVVERATWKQEAPSTNDGIGVVTEVVAARKFGFIHLLDENSTRREMLFFDFKSVTGNGPIRKGDEVKFNIVLGGSKGKRTAVDIVICPKGTLNIPSKAHKDACHGIVLMEPSHTSLSDTPDRKRTGRSRSPKRVDARWEKLDADAEPKKPKSGASIKEEGRILLIKDPTGMFSKKQTKSDTATESSALDENNGGVEAQASSSPVASFKYSHVQYKNGAVAISGSGSSGGADAGQGPKRGDLVSFVKSKSSKGARDVRVVTKGSATMLRGRLEDIAVEGGTGTATFVAATDAQEVYQVDLAEVVSCQLKILKEKESVEGILHDGKIFGICRTADLYLKSKIKSNQKERPKLNLTVRRELGGQIMAQSKMAKGPDGTLGFSSGWTKRASPFVTSEEGEDPEVPTKATSQTDA